MTTGSQARTPGRRRHARRLLLRACAGYLALLAAATQYDALLPGDASLHVVVWAGAVGIALGLPPALLLRRRRERQARAAAAFIAAPLGGAGFVPHVEVQPQ